MRIDKEMASENCHHHITVYILSMVQFDSISI